MGKILTTLGHDPIGMKRATERALGQTSSELESLSSRIIAIEETPAVDISGLEARIADLESRATALEGRVTATETWLGNVDLLLANHEQRIQALETAP